jgi:hypothetical protein
MQNLISVTLEGHDVVFKFLNKEVTIFNASDDYAIFCSKQVRNGNDREGIYERMGDLDNALEYLNSCKKYNEIIPDYFQILTLR